MNFLLLKVSALEYLPEQVLNDWSLEPSRVWQIGSPAPSGQPHEDAGFNLTLPDHEDWEDALSCLSDFLDTKTEMFHELISLGAALELHVGVSLTSQDEGARQLAFPRGLLADLVDREIDLSVIAFPAPGDR